MGQCKSNDRDFKSCANSVVCLWVWGQILLKGTWDSASLRAKTLREIKENMGQGESTERDFKEYKRSKILKNSKEIRP
jgi:hypothetical protein